MIHPVKLGPSSEVHNCREDGQLFRGKKTEGEREKRERGLISLIIKEVQLYFVAVCVCDFTTWRGS